MEKRLEQLVSLVLYLAVGLLLVAALGGAITKRPLLLTAVRSGSMYPTLRRGDAVFIRRVGPATELKSGDIIIFRSEAGSLASQGWIMHRIVAGTDENGYSTQGDANERSDQDSGGAPPIQREWIVSRAVSLAGILVKVPLLGYLPRRCPASCSRC